MNSNNSNIEILNNNLISSNLVQIPEYAFITYIDYTQHQLDFSHFTVEMLFEALKDKEIGSKILEKLGVPFLRPIKCNSSVHKPEDGDIIFEVCDENHELYKKLKESNLLRLNWEVKTNLEGEIDATINNLYKAMQRNRNKDGILISFVAIIKNDKTFKVSAMIIKYLGGIKWTPKEMYEIYKEELERKYEEEYKKNPNVIRVDRLRISLAVLLGTRKKIGNIENKIENIENKIDAKVNEVKIEVNNLKTEINNINKKIDEVKDILVQKLQNI